MKCNICGKEISEMSKFCPKCGTPVEQMHNEQSPANRNVEETDVQGKLDRAHVYLTELYGILAGIMNSLDEGNEWCERKHLYVDDQYSWYWVRVTGPMIMATLPGMILMVIGLMVPKMGFLLALCIPLWIGGYFWLSNERKKRHAAIDKEAEAKASEIHAAIDSAILSVKEHKEELAIIPTDYRFPLAVGAIKKAISDGRANNLREALDRVDTQIHRWRMEGATSAEGIDYQTENAIYEMFGNML